MTTCLVCYSNYNTLKSFVHIAGFCLHNFVLYMFLYLILLVRLFKTKFARATWQQRRSILAGMGRENAMYCSTSLPSRNKAIDADVPPDF